MHRYYRVHDVSVSWRHSTIYTPIATGRMSRPFVSLCNHCAGLVYSHTPQHPASPTHYTHTHTHTHTPLPLGIQALSPPILCHCDGEGGRRRAQHPHAGVCISSLLLLLLLLQCHVLFCFSFTDKIILSPGL